MFYPAFIHSFNFQPNQLLHFKKIFSSTTALRYFKKEDLAQMNSQFTFDEDQEMETQTLYLSSDESEIASPGASPFPQLPNNVPDTYRAITQLLAAQHEQMSSTGNFALQYPPTNFVNLR